MTIEPDYWEQNLQQAALGGVAIPIKSIRRSGRRRAARHEFPYRDGQMVEDIGRGALTFELTVPLFRGMEPVTPGVPLYPDVYNELRNVFDAIGEYGEVEWVDPELGPIPVKVMTHEWVVTSDERNGGTFRIAIEEVSEEAFVGLFLRSEEPKTASIREATFIDENMPIDRTTILEAWAIDGVAFPTSSPETMFSDAVGAFVDDLSAAASTADDVRATVDTFRGRVDVVLNMPEIDAPSAWPVRTSLVLLSDLVTEMGERALAKAPQLIDYTVPEVQSHWTIALILYGDRSRAAEIVQRNPIENPLFYPRGRVLRVLSE